MREEGKEERRKEVREEEASVPVGKQAAVAGSAAREKQTTFSLFFSQCRRGRRRCANICLVDFHDLHPKLVAVEQRPGFPTAGIILHISVHKNGTKDGTQV